MPADHFDRDSWERRWTQVQDAGAPTRAPNAYLVEVAADLTAGRALDAGCGHGTESIWLAQAGWQVTAVDFSATALEIGRTMAEAAGVAARITWAEGDLGSWTPPADRFDLVSCLYVHVSGSVEEMVSRLGAGVAPGGTLLLVGHRPTDPATGAPSPAAGQVQVSVEQARSALDDQWLIAVAEERTRAIEGFGVDAIIRAIRVTSEA